MSGNVFNRESIHFRNTKYIKRNQIAIVYSDGRQRHFVNLSKASAAWLISSVFTAVAEPEMFLSTEVGTTAGSELQK